MRIIQDENFTRPKMRDKLFRGIEADPSLTSDTLPTPSSFYLNRDTLLRIITEEWREKKSRPVERAMIAAGGLSAGASAVSKNDRL